MDTRDFARNKGTIKGPKDLTNRYCLQPFTNADIHSNHGVRCCSESWMPSWIGDFSKQTLREIWNSERVQEIRQSVLDGSYSFCDWHQCPFYSNDELYLYSREELEDPSSITSDVRRDFLLKHQPWVKHILEGNTVLDIMPANYNLAYDESCNLRCPSCRSSMIFHNHGPEFEKRRAIQIKLLEEVEQTGFDHIGRFNLTGSGDPFASRVFTDFLFQFDGRQFPKLDINLQSNGLLFTPKTWEKMWRIHGNINEVIISIDASRPETYAQVRADGDLSKLLDNLAFLSGLRAEGKIRILMLAYVVQQKNYREMVDVVKLAKTLNIDQVLFSLVTDWMSWSKDEFEANAVWKNHHPEFPQFLEVLEDPIFDDPVVDLGNVTQYRNAVRARQRAV
jgi:pyruvate-formate lyase-activating enzyme